MTVSAPLQLPTRVRCVRLGDGKLIRLDGELGEAEVDALRHELLVPLTPGCADVVVDAGAVTALDDRVIAVLLAACAWVEACGGRFLLSRSSPALDRALSELGVADELRRLTAL